MSKKSREAQCEVDARKLLAYAEERALLYREMIKIHEQLMEDLVAEVLNPSLRIDLLAKSMQKTMPVPPQYDV